METQRFVVPVGTRRIFGELHPCAAGAPVIVCCHGLFSSKNSDKFLQIADRFTRNGFSVVRFDFGGCGESSGALADTTVSGRLQDLAAVMDHIAAEAGPAGPVGILGSSLGGYVGMLHAARQPGRVAALSVWSAPWDLPDITRNIPAEDLQQLKRGFFSDARRHDLPAAAGRLSSVQVLHGSADEIVPLEHAGRIYAAARDPKELLVLPGADHAITQPSCRRQALDAGLAWFRRHLAGSR